jgi:hypothetical protein
MLHSAEGIRAGTSATARFVNVVEAPAASSEGYLLRTDLSSSGDTQGEIHHPITQG